MKDFLALLGFTLIPSLVIGLVLTATIFVVGWTLQFSHILPPNWQIFLGISGLCLAGIWLYISIN